MRFFRFVTMFCPLASSLAFFQAPGGSFRFAELFAGIGGFRLGLESLGGRCVFASEIDFFTREVYTLNFGNRPEVLGDIQMIQARIFVLPWLILAPWGSLRTQEEDIPPHDLLVAGGF